MMIEFRRVITSDFEQLVDLQNRNLISILNESEQLTGFLATAFTRQQFQEMDRELCISVCVDAGMIRGYLCASTLEFNKNFIFPAAMIAHASHILYNKKPLLSYRCFVSSPVCIEREYRGGGVFKRLCKKLIEHIPEEYELAISLISMQNNRSLDASTAVGMQIVAEFSLDGKSFWILVCPKSLYQKLKARV
jgi:hypothetical protein